MNRLEEILGSFNNAAIGVVGDVVADVYVMGYPDRLSREAPVMVVRFEEERLIPGCAANTMNNLLALDCQVFPVSVIGDDEHGKKLHDYFAARLSMEGMIQCPGLKTVAKTRIMVGEPSRTKQQVIRVDKELQKEPPPGIEEMVLEAIDRIDRRVDAWLVSDYDYFVVTPAVAERLVSLTRKKPLVVDSRFRSRLFQGARCLTPNESEAMEISAMCPDSEEAVETMGWKVLEEVGSDSLIVTRGNRGMMIFERGGSVRSIPTVGGDEIVDVSGAGDTVSATVTAALVGGATTLEAARLASCAASVVVMKTGAATCERRELGAKLPLLDI